MFLGSGGGLPRESGKGRWALTPSRGMSLYDEMAADFALVLAEFGKPITINGQPHTALISEPAEAVSLQVGGLDVSRSFKAKVARSALPIMPRIGDALAYNHVTYHLRAVEDRPPHPIITLEVSL